MLERSIPERSMLARRTAAVLTRARTPAPKPMAVCLTRGSMAVS